MSWSATSRHGVVGISILTNRISETHVDKRISLSMNVPCDAANYQICKPLVEAFLRLPDQLVSCAHFRPEIMRKIKAVREEEHKKLLKAGKTENAEERRRETEKKKKEQRDERMRGMTAEEQRKFLDKERERESKRGERKMARKA